MKVSNICKLQFVTSSSDWFRMTSAILNVCVIPYGVLSTFTHIPSLWTAWGVGGRNCCAWVSQRPGGAQKQWSRDFTGFIDRKPKALCQSEASTWWSEFKPQIVIIINVVLDLIFFITSITGRLWEHPVMWQFSSEAFPFWAFSMCGSRTTCIRITWGAIPDPLTWHHGGRALNLLV